MTIYSSSTNFASAVTNCYISGEKQVCITNFDSKPPHVTAVTLCDKDGKNCTVHWLDNKVRVVTPEIQTAIKKAQIARSPENQTPNSNDNTNLKNDNGAGLSPK